MYEGDEHHPLSNGVLQHYIPSIRFTILSTIDSRSPTTLSFLWAHLYGSGRFCGFEIIISGRSNLSPLMES